MSDFLRELSMYEEVLGRDDVSLVQIEKIEAYLKRDLKNIETLEMAFRRTERHVKEVKKAWQRKHGLCSCGCEKSYSVGDYLHCENCGLVKKKKKKKEKVNVST